VTTLRIALVLICFLSNARGAEAQAEDAGRVKQLEDQVLDRLLPSGDYDGALVAAREILAIQKRVRGDRSWQAAESRNMVQSLERVAKLPAGARAELTAARKVKADADGLARRGEFAAAEPLYRKAMETCASVMGGDDFWATEARGELAVMLFRLGRHAAADPLFRENLRITRAAYADSHPDTAHACNNLALNLRAQGRSAEADPLFREAIAISRETLGEDDPQTASDINNLALNLQDQGRVAEAEPLYRNALEIWRRKLGEDNPETANGYNNVAYCLVARGRLAEADSFFRKSLAIRLRTLGEDHSDTALGYYNLVRNLHFLGQFAEGESLLRKVIDIARRALGENHELTALAYSALGDNFHLRGRYADADLFYRKSLAILRRILSQGDSRIALSLSSLATNLKALEAYSEAESRLREALAIHRRAKGAGHSYTGFIDRQLGVVLDAQSRHAEAEPLLREALAVSLRELGADHPDTASARFSLAVNLYCLGRYADAEAMWAEAVPSYERARRAMSFEGLGRSAAHETAASAPFSSLAALLARRGQAVPAWRQLESGLARGLFEDLTRSLDPAERSRLRELRAQVRRLDGQLAALDIRRDDGSGKDQGADLRAQTGSLRQRREALRAELADFESGLDRKYGAAAGVAYDLPRIQGQLLADAALVTWVDHNPPPKATDPNGEHWACIVRARGAPVWVRLKGSGTDGAWLDADTGLPEDVRTDLSSRPEDRPARWRERASALAAQRLEPIKPHLGPTDDLPPVRRLIVLTSPALAGVPVEALQEARRGDGESYTISYAPSGTIFAWLRERRRPEPRSGPPRLLALGDPAFPATDRSTPELPPPDHGAAVAQVEAGSLASRAGIQPGDVLLAYNGKDLAGPNDVPREIEKDSSDGIALRIWREGKTLELTLKPGPLGLTFRQKPAAAAVRAQREGDRLLRGSRGSSPVALPGSRREIDAVARLFERPVVLLGRDASTERLDAMTDDDSLRRFDVLHFATHGLLDDCSFLQSALLLAWDDRADPVKRALDGQPVSNGRLTAEQILQTWKLDADLVTLSACQSGLGRSVQGEGYLGFAQALFLAGARRVVLSLWKVDDDATALLMTRFYANLIGRHDAASASQSSAEALSEAKQWLRGLNGDQVEAALGGLSRGTERRPPISPARAPAQPFAHPYYWAGFVLVGDPN
jgi:tetratricopeptide (TPR) repeat protein